ncbi:MAG: class IV adenylate cyclase [Candidatus Aminicenantes bacterium]|nr:class IV adenylate cyclase [Candidatus Aminicenantes bacterium]
MPEESPLEIEAKVPLEVEDLDGVRSRLREIGARLGTPRLREENTLFDFPDGRLEKADSALRVRTFGRECLLTYKGRAREHAFLKLREEIETRVEDAAALIRLLELLGLRKAFHYWKFREIYSLELPLGTVTVALDETPIGFFAEVEGPEESIGAVVELMGWDPASFIRESYPKLYREHGLGAPGAE